MMQPVFTIEGYKPDAVIFGCGDFPTHKVPMSILAHAKYLCCCDGAAAKFVSMGVIPDAIVGDGDSLPQQFKDKYHNILHLVEEQEDNDQTKATRFCMNLGLKDIAYLGATGRREDHTIGNISLLGRYMSDFGLYPVMLTDFGYFVPSQGIRAFASFPRQQVSIFNLTCSKLESEGLKWQSYAYKQLWQGTLNEATGNIFTLKTDGNYIVYMTYEAKPTLAT